MRTAIAIVGLSAAAVIFPACLWCIWGGNDLSFKILMTAALTIAACLIADNVTKAFSE